MKTLTKKVSTLLMATAASVTLLASPAMAEGSWSSSLSNVRTGFTSRSWQDSHTDGAATVTNLNGCNLSTVDVSLWDEFGAFPDYRVSGIGKACGAYNFGVMQRPDRYHFKIDKLNGQVTSNYLLNVRSVVQTY